MKTKTLTVLVCGALLAAAGSSDAQSTFTKITTGAIVTDGGSSYGCAASFSNRNRREPTETL